MSNKEETQYYIIHRFFSLNSHEMLDFIVENKDIVEGPMDLEQAQIKLKILPQRKHGWYQIIKEKKYDTKRNTKPSGNIRKISRRESCKNARID